MKWIEVSIMVKDEGTEAAAALLLEAGAQGIAIEDPLALQKMNNQKGNWDYVELPEGIDASKEIEVKGWFKDDLYFSALLHEIEKGAQKLNSYGLDAGSCKVFSQSVQDDNWATAWQEHYKPFRIGKNLVIRPVWEELELKDDDLEIILDPGLAFGTGMHPTTKLCLEALEDYLLKGSSFLDVGAGSGILTIAAKILGAESLTSVDNDSLAVESCIRNLKLNNMKEGIKVIAGNLADEVESPVNLIVANIVADAILGLLDDVKRLLLPQGIFIAGGIITGRKDEVVNEMKAKSLRILEIKEEGEWVAVVTQKD